MPTPKISFSYVAQTNDTLPLPIAWLSTNEPGGNPYVPFAVTKLPEAYAKALRDTYDPSKMYWASNQVMALTQGYYNIMQPIVSEALRKSEEKSLHIVESSQGLSKDKFAERLNKNAVNVFADWKGLYAKLLTKFNGGEGVRYEKLPTPDTPAEYDGVGGKYVDSPQVRTSAES